MIPGVGHIQIAGIIVVTSNSSSSTTTTIMVAAEDGHQGIIGETDTITEVVTTQEIRIITDETLLIAEIVLTVVEAVVETSIAIKGTVVAPTNSGAPTATKFPATHKCISHHQCNTNLQHTVCHKEVGDLLIRSLGETRRSRALHFVGCPVSPYVTTIATQGIQTICLRHKFRNRGNR